MTRAKISVFVISACLASVAGSLYADYFRYLSPDQVGSAESLQLITMLVIGGDGHPVRPAHRGRAADLPAARVPALANYSMLLTGVLLVLFLRYLPAGIWGGVLEVVARARARGHAGAASPGGRTRGRAGAGLVPASSPGAAHPPPAGILCP